MWNPYYIPGLIFNRSGFTWLCCLLLLTWACKKQHTSPPQNIITSDTPFTPFTRYIIRQGNQFCDQDTFVHVAYDELKFVVKFDSSAIYTAVNPVNQYDINKLYGFSDNNSFHQLYSARFGWRWSNQALRIFAYIYNNGVRDSKELGTIQPGTENTCSIKVSEGHYIFSLNNSSDTLVRSSTTAKGEGYRLYPYFGGDEAASHDISIFIRELKAD